MKITIKTFAHFKDICGFQEKELTVSDNITISDILREITRLHPEMHKHATSVLCAINQEYKDLNYRLNDGDKLALFPPVSGG